MQTLALINPRRRRGAKRRKTRSAAQRAATARMLAANRRRSNPRRARRRVARSAAPVAHVSHRRARRRNPVALYRRRGRARRRNPISMGSLTSGIAPAMWGAGGAVAVQAVANMLSGSLPTTLTTGYMKYLVNAGLAVALGKFGGRVLGQRAHTMAAGALVVTAYQLIRDVATANGLSLGLSGLGSMGWSTSGVSYAPNANLPARFSGLGEHYYNGMNGANTAVATGGMGEYVY